MATSPGGQPGLQVGSFAFEHVVSSVPADRDNVTEEPATPTLLVQTKSLLEVIY